MPFILQLLIAIIILAFGLSLKTISSDISVAGDLYFLFGTIGAQFWLFISAIRLRAKNLPRFDMLVAAELIIALGILSLILGIIISVFFAFRGGDRLAGLTAEALRPLLAPFAVGLFAAGVAPVLATTLRQIEVLKYGGGKDVEGAPEDDLESLKVGIREAIVVLNNFSTACDRSRTTFEKTATSFSKSADSYDAAATKIQAALGHLADVAATEVSRFGAGLEAMATHLAKYEERLKASTHEMNSLTEATTRFRAAAEEGAALVGGLQKVIESIERFIDPDR